MGNTVLMEEMTWREIQQALHDGADTAILVAASVEQHGPHLPTGTDTMIGYALAAAVAAKMGNALVAPVIRPALSGHHMDFPGTITLRMKTFVKVVEEYCFSFQKQGFKNIVLFVSHGGNADALKALSCKDCGFLLTNSRTSSTVLATLTIFPVSTGKQNSGR